MSTASNTTDRCAVNNYPSGKLKEMIKFEYNSSNSSPQKLYWEREITGNYCQITYQHNHLVMMGCKQFSIVLGVILGQPRCSKHRQLSQRFDSTHAKTTGCICAITEMPPINTWQVTEQEIGSVKWVTRLHLVTQGVK